MNLHPQKLHSISRWCSVSLKSPIVYQNLVERQIITTTIIHTKIPIKKEFYWLVIGLMNDLISWENDDATEWYMPLHKHNKSMQTKINYMSLLKGTRLPLFTTFFCCFSSFLHFINFFSFSSFFFFCFRRKQRYIIEQTCKLGNHVSLPFKHNKTFIWHV